MSAIAAITATHPGSEPAAGAAAPLLQVEGIEVVYGGAILAASGVSLAVPEGRIVALLGANGAGKSTVLKAISGLLAADRASVSQGRIAFGGQSTQGVAAHQLVRRGIVHVLEGRHVFPHLTVEENLRSGGFLRGPGRQELQRALERVYAWFPRLKDKRQVAAGYTSGGEQQMVAIGRALMTQPRLVLLDEPSMGLAPLIVQEIFEIVAELNARENVAFLVAEQNIALALRHAHHGYVLETGRVVLQGPAEALRRDGALQEAYLGKKQ
ncbi:MAG: ABC transporter ATP-binding protein [Comamonas sp.]